MTTNMLLELFRLEQTKKERGLSVEEVSRYEYLHSMLSEDAKSLWDDISEERKRKTELLKIRCERDGMFMIKVEDLLHYGGFDITIGYTDDYFEEFGKVRQLFVNEKDQTVLLVAEKGRVRI